MNYKKNHLSLFVFITIGLLNSANAQVFTGFSAFEKVIEFEGQRFLMDNIYQIKTEDFDKLKIDKTITEIDSNEGFMFVLTSYIFNSKSGVVITSFNSTSFSNEEHQFVNIHLTHDEFRDLHNVFKELKEANPESGEHVLRKFNDRLIIDVNNIGGYDYFVLWVDNYSRHTFTTTKWDKAVRKHMKFIEK